MRALVPTLALLAGCSGVFGIPDHGELIGGGTPDAGVPSQPDAAAPPDANLNPTHTGAIAIHDVSIVGQSQFGHGLQVSIAFNQVNRPVEEMATNGIPFPPCFATRVDVTKGDQANPPLPEGRVDISMGAPQVGSLPTCTFNAGTYQCISAQGTGGTVVATANPKVLTFTNTTVGAPSFGSELAGMYLVIVDGAGSGMTLPVVGAAGLQLGLQKFGTPPSPIGAWVVAAGIGPFGLTAQPDGSGEGPAPDLLVNATAVTVTLSGGADFAAQSTQNLMAGSAFLLDPATRTILESGLDLDTASDVTFACDHSSGYCPLASGMVVQIDTSDAGFFTGPVDMGTPIKYRASLTCAALDDHVTIPANLIGVLRRVNPTRIRIGVFRDGFNVLTNPAPPRNSITVVAGHGFVAYQTP